MVPINEKNKNINSLTYRQKLIINILTKFTVGKPITISAISEKLSLSSRTVLREMAQVEKWLTDNEFNFERKPGVGLILHNSETESERLLGLLENEEHHNEFTKEHRRAKILSELLQNTEPVKSYAFTIEFKISETTLQTDLEYISIWLSNYGLNLIRRQGVGIYLEGNEVGFRQATSHAVFEFTREDDILHILKDDKTVDKNLFFGFIDLEEFKTVSNILNQAQHKFSIKYADNAYMFLAVNIALAVKRIRLLHFAEIDREKLITLRSYDEFAIAEYISDRLAEMFGIKISENETAFITMYLMSQNIGIKASDDKLDFKNINMRMLALTLISNVEKELSINLEDDKLLAEDLCNHMDSVISRLSVGIKIKNYQIKEIKQTYPDVFLACENACEILKPITNATEISESEVAFIAMHFCAAIERKISATKKIRVAVVCPTGISTSRMLVASIKKDFPEILVSGTLSAITLDVGQLKDRNIDLLISTVELKIDFPYVTVNPILLEQDKILIKNKIKNLDTNREKREVNRAREHKFILKNEINYISELGKGILDVSENFALTTATKVANKLELLKIASSLFSEKETEANFVLTSLEQREKLGETYINELNMLFLHCKTEVVDTCRFGYIRLETAFKEEEKTIDGAVVMLLSGKNERAYADILSQISGAFIENPNLVDLVKYENISDILSELDLILGKFYKLSILKRLEW